MSEPLNPFSSSPPPIASISESDIPRLDPPQSVRFAHTAETIAAFWSHRTHASASDKRTRRNNLITAGCLVLTAPVVLVVFAVMGMIPPFVGLLALCYSVLIVGWFLNSLRPSTIDAAYLREVQRLLDEAPNEQLRGMRTMTLEPEGVRELLPYGESFIRWEGYERITHDDHYAFFCETSMTAVVVPRNAFASQSQFLGFVRLAQRLWEEHHSNSNTNDGAAIIQPSPNADAV